MPAPAGSAPARRKSWRRLVFLLLLLFSTSLAVNLFLAKQLQDSFGRLHFSRLFPLGYTEANDFPVQSGQPWIAFFGDSRALSWYKEASTASLQVASFAHGSTTSSQLLLQLQVEPVVHTDIAIVQIGINDLHPIGALPLDKDLILRRLRENIPAIRDALLARSDTVVLTTIFPPGHVPLRRRAVWDPATLRYLDQINEVIRAAADGKRVLLLDAHAILSGNDSYLNDRFTDPDFFLHVNSEAYSQLNAELRRLLAQHSQGRS